MRNPRSIRFRDRGAARRACRARLGRALRAGVSGERAKAPKGLEKAASPRPSDAEWDASTPRKAAEYHLERAIHGGARRASAALFAETSRRAFEPLISGLQRLKLKPRPARVFFLPSRRPRTIPYPQAPAGRAPRSPSMNAKTSFPPTKLYIGGQWVDGPNKVIVMNKFTGEVSHELSGAGVDEVNAAVAAAKAAQPLIAKMPIWRRAEILNKTSQLLAENRAEIAKCIAREVGKAVKYAGFEVDRAVDTFRLAAEEAAQIHGETIPLDAVKSGEGLFGFWHRKPLGIVGAITPFNFPLNLAAHKIAPALAAGNTIVLKPAEATSLTGAWIVALLEQAGLPPGVINLVHGK